MIHKYIKIINYVIFKVHLIFQLFSKSIQKVNRGIIRVNLQNDTKFYYDVFLSTFEKNLIFIPFIFFILDNVYNKCYNKRKV